MKETEDPTLGIGFLLQDVSRSLRRNFNKRVQSLGLTQAQWRAIAYLSRNEDINQASLADLLEVQPISLARLIDRMQLSGWVERRPDPDDRRAVKLFLTDKAQPLLSEMGRRAADVREQAFMGFSKKSRRQLIEMLQQLKINLANMENNDLEEVGKRD